MEQMSHSRPVEFECSGESKQGLEAFSNTLPGNCYGESPQKEYCSAPSCRPQSRQPRLTLKPDHILITTQLEVRHSRFSQVKIEDEWVSCRGTNSFATLTQLFSQIVDKGS